MKTMTICWKHNTCTTAIEINCPHKDAHEDMSYCGNPRKYGHGCNYDKEAYCIPYVRELQVGDRVRVLGKTFGNRDFNSLVGKIGYVSGIRSDHVSVSCSKYSISGDNFAPQDLEKLDHKEDAVKYKALKPLTLAILNENASGDELEHFVNNYLKWSMGSCFKGMDRKIPINAQLIEYAKQKDCFWKFLTEGGYIEEEISDYDKWKQECPLHAINSGSLMTNDTIKFEEWAKRMPRKD